MVRSDLGDVANRHRGAFGFPAPYGHAPLDYEEIRFNMDIVGGATGSLCEAWRSRSCAGPLDCIGTKSCGPSKKP